MFKSKILFLTFMLFFQNELLCSSLKEEQKMTPRQKLSFFGACVVVSGLTALHYYWLYQEYSKK